MDFFVLIILLLYCASAWKFPEGPSLGAFCPSPAPVNGGPGLESKVKYAYFSGHIDFYFLKQNTSQGCYCSLGAIIGEGLQHSQRSRSSRQAFALYSHFPPAPQFLTAAKPSPSQGPAFWSKERKTRVSHFDKIRANRSR